ncbi:hypothetical protein GCM10027406_25940 [Leifsonia lichenia]
MASIDSTAVRRFAWRCLGALALALYVTAALGVVFALISQQLRPTWAIAVLLASGALGAIFVICAIAAHADQVQSRIANVGTAVGSFFGRSRLWVSLLYGALGAASLGVFAFGAASAPQGLSVVREGERYLARIDGDTTIVSIAEYARFHFANEIATPSGMAMAIALVVSALCFGLSADRGPNDVYVSSLDEMMRAKTRRRARKR